MNTLQDIAKSAKKIDTKQKHKPLPIESYQNSSTLTAELFPDLASEFKILSFDYSRLSYYDKRLKTTLPKFVTLDIESDGVFQFDNTGAKKWRINKGDGHMNPLALDDGIGRRMKRKIYTFCFMGTVPDKTRELYEKNKDKFDFTYLICDAQNQWSAKSAPKTPDPIMIGVKWQRISEANNDWRFGGPHIFIIDVFDLTFDESYLTKEF